MSDEEFDPLLAVPHPTTGEEYIERNVTADIVQALLNTEQGGVTGRVGLAGMGGIGKTEMAIHLVLRIKDQFEGGVLWVPFRDREDASILRDMAAHLRVPVYPEADEMALTADVMRALGERPRTLLVYDDIRARHQPTFKELFSPPANCALLITTRLQSLAMLPAGMLYSLDVFSEAESLDLMRGILGDATCDAEPEALKEVTGLCGYLALALNVSARHILRDRSMRGMKNPIAWHAARLQDERNRLEALDLITNTEELSVRTVLSASYYDLDEEAQRRFDTLGAFPEVEFPGSLVTLVWWPELLPTNTLETIQLREQETYENLDDLVSRSMLQLGTKVGRYRLHDLWHDFTRDRLGTYPVKGTFAHYSHAVACAVYAQQHYSRVEVPLLEREYDNLRAAVDWAQAAPHADLLYRLAWETRYLMLFSGRWAEGQVWLEAALAVLEDDDVEEDGHSRRAYLEGALASLTMNREGYGRVAEERLKRNIELSSAIDDRKDVAVAQGKLADLAVLRGDYEAAEQLLNAALATSIEIGYWRDVAVKQGKLADLAMRRGDYPEAERLFREALDTMEELGDRQQAATLRGKQADLAMFRGDYEEAERLNLEVIREFRQFGDRHGVATRQVMLAQTLMDVGRKDEGCNLYKNAVESLKQMGDAQAADIEQIWRRYCLEEEDEQPDPALIQTVTEFVNADGWDGSRKVLDAHSELLSDEADVVFNWYILAAETNDREEYVPMLTAYRDLLRTCRKIGVKAAFEQVHGPSDPLGVMVNTTIIVMMRAAEHREDWLNSMVQLQSEVKGKRSASQIVALAGAIVKLLTDDQPNNIDVSALKGDYRVAWERIVAGLSDADPDQD